MHLLHSAQITGLWGERDVEIVFHSDVNFLIGANGSGKTTVINLIAATLNTDFETLDRIPFDKVHLRLEEANSTDRSKTATIEVEKKAVPELPFPRVTVSFRGSPKAKTVSFSLDQWQEDVHLRRYRTAGREMFRRVRTSFGEELKGLTNVSWLSIHRYQGGADTEESKSVTSSVDKKLVQLNNEFVKYFSLLSKRADNEAASFQEKVFLSLIYEQTDTQLWSSIQQLDLDQERASLIDIFRNFNLKDTQFSASVDKQFAAVDEAVRNAKKTKGYSAKDFFALLNMWRVHAVVQEWRELVKQQKLIYQPKATFLDLINKQLVGGKKLAVNDKNELEAVTASGKTLSLMDLSSGEKQLIIILGQALLQECAAWIYIADEPELSLHMTWQVQLVANLRALNPNAQVIFATHSPDLVASFGSKVFDMGNLKK